MKSYIIERDGESWVLRLPGRQETLASGPTAGSIKEQAFERVRQWAPCRIQVIGDVVEEWQLADLDGDWEENRSGPEPDTGY